MKVILLIGIFLISQSTSDRTQNGCLKSDLEQFNGFYTSLEMNGGILTIDNIPTKILERKNQKAQSISIEYLNKVKDGYLLTFGIKYIDYETLVISTLNSEYCLQDYRIYPNTYHGGEVKKDTIAMPWYDSNSVTIELMNPNKDEQPYFKVDGLWKETYVVGTDLSLQLTDKTAR